MGATFLFQCRKCKFEQVRLVKISGMDEKKCATYTSSFYCKSCGKYPLIDVLNDKLKCKFCGSSKISSKFSLENSKCQECKAGTMEFVQMGEQ